MPPYGIGTAGKVKIVDFAQHRPLLCRPGQNHDRRPEFYKKLTEPQDDAFHYFYFNRGLDAWKEEYEKIKKSK